MFLQSILQILDRRGCGGGLAAPAWSGAAELPRDKSLGRTNRGAPAQDRFGNGVLFVRRFQREKGFCMADGKQALDEPGLVAGIFVVAAGAVGGLLDGLELLG